MKFKDIPKFTSIGNYQINVSFDYLKCNIDRYIENFNLNMIPDFQRGHIWTEEQQIAFVEYFLKGGKSGTVIYFNHPNWTGSFEGEMVLVDGLQRVTACLKFLNNELKVFGHFCNEIDDILIKKVDLIFNVNNLKTRKEVLTWYLEMNIGGVVHSKEAIDKVKKLLENEVEKKL